jgi:hypothetical protein
LGVRTGRGSIRWRAAAEIFEVRVSGGGDSRRLVIEKTLEELRDVVFLVQEHMASGKVPSDFQRQKVIEFFIRAYVKTFTNGRDERVNEGRFTNNCQVVYMGFQSTHQCPSG